MSPCQACGHYTTSETHTDDGHARKSKKPPKYTSKIYQPLPESRGYIRLLNVIGSDSENPFVECELILQKFDKEGGVTDDPNTHPYEALSWCWGLAKAKSHIIIRKDGKSYAKFVSPDLVAALKTLRYPNQNRYLWVDAVCINQKNVSCSRSCSLLSKF